MYQDNMQLVILGRIEEGDRRIRLDEDIRCNECRKRVPGGIQTSARFYDSGAFDVALQEFKDKYLCGICRDAQRREHNSSDGPTSC